MTIIFGADVPLAFNALPGNSVGLGWHNNNRKRLEKLAQQYRSNPPAAVAMLQSQGEPDVSVPNVVASRAAFNELRVRLPVLSQFYQYSISHGGGGDAAILAHIKAIVLAWVTLNTPTGKPIDETNFEGLLQVIGVQWARFSSAEQTIIGDWLNALKQVRLTWDFAQLPGEGTIQYGNHYTHHYKILLKTCALLGDSTTYNSTLGALDAFAAVNFPYGNPAVMVPDDMPRAATHVGESIDMIRRDALHYQQYNLEPWLEIAILEGGTRYEAVVDHAFAYMAQECFAPAVKRYEFTNSTDSFDSLRWEASNPEYLQPESMYRPEKAARVALAYQFMKQQLESGFQMDGRWWALACRSDVLPSVWYYYFRTVFGGIYG